MHEGLQNMGFTGAAMQQQLGGVATEYARNSINCAPQIQASIGSLIAELSDAMVSLSEAHASLDARLQPISSAPVPSNNAQKQAASIEPEFIAQLQDTVLRLRFMRSEVIDMLQRVRL